MNALYKIGDRVTTTRGSIVDLTGLKIDPIITDIVIKNDSIYYRVQWQTSKKSRLKHCTIPEINIIPL